MFPAYSKIWLINVSLAAVIVVLGIMSFDVWTKKDDPGTDISTVKEPTASSPDKRIIQRAVPPKATYNIVVEKDLLSPDRSEYLPADNSKPEQSKISDKRIFLFGVMTLGDQTQALVNSPEIGPDAAGGQVKDRWVKVGDTIGTFTVAEIEKEKIVLTEGADRYEILLYDESKPARGQRTAGQKPSTPTVVLTGSNPPASPGASGASVSSVPKPDPGPGAVQNDPAGEYEIVNTPFGPTKRRIK